MAVESDGEATPTSFSSMSMLQIPGATVGISAAQADVEEHASSKARAAGHSQQSFGIDQAQVSVSAVFAEYVAMTLFVVIGCGSAMAIAKEEGSAWVMQVAFTFGFAITVLAYSIGHYSGGHINCAVTFGLVLTGNCGILQGILNVVAQMMGSVTGAGILRAIFPENMDKTGGLATNSVSEGYSKMNACAGEIMMTFLLMFTVLETAANPLSVLNRSLACVAIGLAVFLAHSVLIPIDGCSINPTRSFGPALVAKFTYKEKEVDSFGDMWVFWIGPMVGAAAAAVVSMVVRYMYVEPK